MVVGKPIEGLYWSACVLRAITQFDEGLADLGQTTWSRTHHRTNQHGFESLLRYCCRILIMHFPL